MYASKDSRVRVTHKENGGGSATRKAGIDAAIGKYYTEKVATLDHPLYYYIQRKDEKIKV